MQNLEKRLLNYTLAAGATAILAPSAEGAVIHTLANQDIPENSFYGLDVNNDGLTDFDFSHYGYQSPGYLTANFLDVCNCAASNQIVIEGPYAAALNLGAIIGPSQSFYYPSAYEYGVMVYRYSYTDGYGNTYGQTYGYWLNAMQKFLGLKFDDGNGNTFYGWARLTVQDNDGKLSVFLHDYAYEDSGREIIAGDEGVPEPGSLGLLALGAVGLGLLRRKHSAAK